MMTLRYALLVGAAAFAGLMGGLAMREHKDLRACEERLIEKSADFDGCLDSFNFCQSKLETRR